MLHISVLATVASGAVVAMLTLAPVSAGDVPGSDKIHHFLALPH